MKEQVEKQQDIDQERELIIEEEADEKAGTDDVEIEETNTVDVECDWKETSYGELVDETFEHARDTMKANDKIDWFVMGCGFFAIVCLIISTINVVRYGFDWVFGIMMTAYVVVAVFCLWRKLQYKFGRFYWKATFAKKIVSKAKPIIKVSFGDEAVSFQKGKKTSTYLYDKMWDVYETVHFFIFHISDRSIISISKEDIAKAQTEYEDIDLTEYFINLCNRYHHVDRLLSEPEEAVDETVEEFSENPEQDSLEDAEESVDETEE